MRNNIFYLILILILTSCSKKVEFQGKITGSSPLERIEFIEASGVATLPLINLGFNSDGTFGGTFEVPKNGMYLMTYGENQKLLYIKKGQSLQIFGDAYSDKLIYKGEAKANNTFLDQSQDAMFQYAHQFNIEEKMKLPQGEFLKALKKAKTDLFQQVETIAKNNKADADVLEWKKNDMKVGLLDILFNYKETTKQKPSAEFLNFEKELKSNEDELIENFAAYRSYLLNELSTDFDIYFQQNGKGKLDVCVSEVFADFLQDKTKLSTTAKDYLIAFVMAQMDITQQTEPDKINKLVGVIDKHIKKESVKMDLNKVIKAIAGLDVGKDAPNSPLVLADETKTSVADFKGKPTVLFFYSSWTPNLIAEIEVLNEYIDFYKSEINFIAINFDDTLDQFKKTSASVINNKVVKNAYASSGLNSEFAKDYFIYGFKLKPTYIVLDKEAKIASPFYFHVKDERMTKMLNQLSGLKFIGSGAVLQNDLVTPETK